ncbi:MAG: TIGR02444 family protein [Alteromonadaceae bacterium]|nr:TIGR02444 family protein [Alteromonadaceae bacterium]
MVNQTAQLPPAPLQTDTPLWQFSVKLWGNPRSADAALALQAQGWVVSHLLVAAFSAQQGRVWDGREPETIKAWRQEATMNLRSLRRFLPKSRPDLSDLRQRLAQAELEAERIELAWWSLHLQQQPLPSTRPQGALALLADNLAAAAEPSAQTVELLADFASELIPAATREALTEALQARAGYADEQK